MKSTFAFAFAIAILLGGCKPGGPDYSDLGLVEVTGKVTLDGQPLAGVTVRFEGPPSRFADGKTDSGGNFQLMYDSTKPGCTPGEKVVRITSGAPGEETEEGAPVEGPDGKVAPQVQTIPAAYNTTSQLKADVSSSNKYFTFDLKSRP
jgi:hypothetical protein